MSPGEPDVAVVGAGAAGIAAARTLAALGRSCLVLEAAGRVGGRAFTDTAGLGAPFDQGASWLHEAEANPLTPIARRLGFTLRDERRRVRDILLVDGGRIATAEERTAHDAACEAWDAAAEARAARSAKDGGPDIPLSEAVPRGGEWDATAAHWLGAIINGAEPEITSLRDYVATGLGGRNLQPAEGLGTLVARLAEGLPVVLDAPVARIAWGGPGGAVAAEGPRGTVRARGCIVTVSTGVLAAGGLRFDPPLPAPLQEAIAGLPLGLLTKVALRAATAGEDRLDLPAFARLGRRVEGPGDRPMSWMLWPFGRDHAVGFIGASQFATTLGTRFGMAQVVTGALILYAAFALILLAVTLAGVDRLAVLVVLLFLAFANLGLVIPTTMVLALDDHGPIAGLASALGGTLQMITGGAMIAVSGLFFDGTARPMVGAIAICAVAALLLALATPKPKEALNPAE